MLKDRIELESDDNYDQRYDRESVKRQNAFENAWDLREGFGSLGAKIFDGLVNLMEGHHEKLNHDNFGRRRFFRITGSVRIPLP